MKPFIVIVNDDGIDAPGIWHLWHALKDSAELMIIAPDSDKSCVGLGASLRTPLFIKPVKWEENTPAYKINGTPVDCIKMGLHTILKRKPDLIVSGINRGSNAGRNVLYSGTIGAVIEGCMRGIAGIAFSAEDFINPDYAKMEEPIRAIVSWTLEHKLPTGTILSVSFPEGEFKGIKLAKQGLRFCRDAPEERIHPEGHTYYWLGWGIDHFEEDPESDIHLLKEGFVTAVPLHVHTLTDNHFRDERGVFFEEICNKFESEALET